MKSDEERKKMLASFALWLADNRPDAKTMCEMMQLVDRYMEYYAKFVQHIHDSNKAAENANNTDFQFFKIISASYDPKEL